MGVFLGVGWHTLSKGERLELAVICCQLDLKRLNNEYLFPCSRIIPNIADSAHDILIGAKRRQGPGGSDRKRRGSAKGRRVRRGKLATAVRGRVARFHVPLHSSPCLSQPPSQPSFFSVIFNQTSVSLRPLQNPSLTTGLSGPAIYGFDHVVSTANKLLKLAKVSIDLSAPHPNPNDHY
jgi:hypothetical protein